MHSEVALAFCLLLMVTRGPAGVESQACNSNNPCNSNGGACLDSSSSLPGFTVTGSGTCCGCLQDYSGTNCANSDSTAVSCLICSSGTSATYTDGTATLSAPYCLCDGNDLRQGATSCGGGSGTDAKTCFPDSGRVVMQGLAADMKHVGMGDKVWALDEASMSFKYSPIYMFGHRSPRVRTTYRRVHTRRGALTASPGHYVWRRKRVSDDDSNGDDDQFLHLVEMRDVSVGDLVLMSPDNGTAVWEEAVTSTENILETGLYNPQTVTGNIVVDGVLASCYSNILPAPLGHASLWIVRQTYNMVPLEWSKYQQHYIINPIIYFITGSMDE